MASSERRDVVLLVLVAVLTAMALEWLSRAKPARPAEPPGVLIIRPRPCSSLDVPRVLDEVDATADTRRVW